MDLVTSSYLPGDPRLIDQIVYELKSQGIFDQFRKECIADVDTKPAYQNLSQRVEGSVMNFLRKQKFSENMNKNQLREQLRKNISESGFLETGVERIVDQVVNPKINTIFLPKVEDVVYRYLGIEKPNQEIRHEMKADIDLLPNDLEAISPESVHDHSFNSNSDKKDESIEINENSLNSSNTKTEDESPPFELLEENTKFSIHEENSVDSHLSGISGLASHESGHSTEIKDDIEMDISQDVSQASVNSEGNLSIVTSEEDIKMEICEDSNLSDIKELKREISGDNDNPESIENKTTERKYIITIDETDVKEKALEIDETLEEKTTTNEIIKTEVDSTKSEDKNTNENKNDPKKIQDKHKSSRSDKDKKDSKDKKSKSKSDTKSKDHKDSKSHSKHSSSTKDKESEKDKKDYRNGKDKKVVPEKDKQVKKEDKERDKSKDKSSKSKEKSEKDRDRSEKEKDKVTKDKDKSDKERIYKDKSDKDRSDKHKEKSDKEKNRPEKSKSDREKVDKEKSDKDKLEKEKTSSSKHKEKSSSSSKKDGSSKGEDKSSGDKSSSSKDRSSSSSSKYKESSNKDKDNTKISKDKDRSKSGSSSSKNKDSEKKSIGDSKSRSSDKHRKSDKERSTSSHHDKSNSSFKKDKDKKAVDDHYSIKDKKSERRSTDRDSNDGSSKMSRNGSFTESYSQSLKGSSKESSEVFSSGSGDSSNSDKMEDRSVETAKNVDNMDIVNTEALQTIKYNKPKFASNIHEAMKIMKIRKQLAKLERQNQLSLTHVQVKDSPREPSPEQHLKGLSVVLEKTLLIPNPAISEVDDVNNKEKNKLPAEYKSDKEEPRKLPDKQQIRNEESESRPEIVCNQHVELIREAKELDTGKPPMLKSQDLSMESFEALEARLAQEMSNVNYKNIYGEEDDNYECVSVSFSPVKITKDSDELKPCIKKILFDTSNANNDGDMEFELVVSKQVKQTSEEIDIIEKDATVPIIISDSLEPDVFEQAEVHSEEETDLNNIIVENGEELVIDEVREEFIDYIQEPTIDDIFSIDHSVNVDNEKERVEEKAEHIQETVIELHEKCGFVAIIREECNKELENEDVDIKVNDFNDDFKGFDDVDRDDVNVIKFTEEISDMGRILDELVKKHIAEINIPELPTKRERDKIESPGKEDTIIFKSGLSSSIKKVTSMPPAIQDLLQKNGKKLFIKVDKLENNLPSKVLVTLQGMETNGIINNPVCEVDSIDPEEEIDRQDMKKECNEERVQQAGLCNGEEPNQNGEIFKEPSNGIEHICLPKPIENGLVDGDKWADDDSPCYYFDETNSSNEFNLKVLHDMIEKLEKTVEKQSLQIHNNIPSVKKRGRKRKAQSTENNNSIGAHCKPESKRKHVSFATTNQNGGNLCNNTNISQNQSFSLPLSPADSEKSDEHKKEEPVTVKTKRTGRVSNTKRYSSEDLYKPRPVLSSSTRRRSAKLEHKP